MENYEDYYGRWFTVSQLSTEEKKVAVALFAEGSTACLRCKTPFQEDWRLPNNAFYCRECLMLGCVRSDQPLYFFPQKPFVPQEALVWQGRLTPFQQMVSDSLCVAIDRQESVLVHAVTGAGKTEMIYAVLAKVVRAGGAVCIASPRIDVCIELHKRLERDFSCQVSLLHGQSDPYTRSPILVATTHQLLKFYQAFDLVIIDEVDAFPYVDNPVLYQAVENAKKSTGLSFYLTATSTEELNRQIEKGKLKRVSLPRRFHGNPLVVPKTVWCPRFLKHIEKNRLPFVIQQSITKQRNHQWPLLIFAPEIALGQKLASLLRDYFPDERIDFVSSQTENRLDIVEAFRSGELSILISTTILERGVTFPGVDVMVFAAEDKVYSASSLIQISGRVGRSTDRPTGEVLFFSEGKTQAIETAIREIKAMNQEAGYV